MRTRESRTTRSILISFVFTNLSLTEMNDKMIGETERKKEKWLITKVGRREEREREGKHNYNVFDGDRERGGINLDTQKREMGVMIGVGGRRGGEKEREKDMKRNGKRKKVKIFPSMSRCFGV